MPRADYRLRKATKADAQIILHHRMSMFRDMGLKVDRHAVKTAFARWLRGAMQQRVYHAWMIETRDGRVAAGAGLSVLPWPPGPMPHSGRMAYVYNVYTERVHRRRGLAKQLMKAIHRWCRTRGIRLVGLHASKDGQRLYQSMGYEPTNEMRLILR